VLTFYQNPAFPPDGPKYSARSRDGAPDARELLHDKSVLQIVRKHDGKRVAYLSGGSLNFSAHIDNAEDQALYVLDAEDVTVRNYKASIDGLIRNNPEYCLESTLATIRWSAGQVTGHSDLEVPVAIARRIRQGIRKGKIDEVTKALEELVDVPSDLSQRPTREEARAAVKRVDGFLRWYFTAFDRESIKTPSEAVYRAKRLGAIIPKVASWNKDGMDFARHLNKITWNPKLGNALGSTQQKWLDEAWKAVGGGGKAPRVADVAPAFYASGSSNPKPVIFNFDFDGNLVYMPTKIQVFRKPGADPKLPAMRAFSGAEWAAIDHFVGTDMPAGLAETYGSLKDYEIVQEAGGRDSFEFFRNAGDGSGGRNFALEEIRQVAVKGGPTDWMGPAFVALKYACSSRDACDNVRIITARSQSPQEMYEVFQYLRDQGFIKHSPRLENLYCVGGPPGVELPRGHTAAAKAEIMLNDLRQLDYKKISDKWDPITPPDGGEKKGRFHVWTFSDDDYKNYAAARDSISAEIRKGKFRNTKVMLFYTGLSSTEHSPEAIVLTPDGMWRALAPGEEADIEQMLKLGPDCAPLLKYEPKVPKKVGSVNRMTSPYFLDSVELSKV
jgi:hypothetical protein